VTRAQSDPFDLFTRSTDGQRAYEQDRRARYVIAEAARAVCDLCDSSGYRPNLLLCDHIDRSETVRRGMALIRDVLKLAELNRQADVEAEESS
jgi:hypothetical protein